jgi:hypothetical protein
VLGAEQMLADLAFIQSEQPGALADTRGVIAVAPRSSVTGASFASFLDTLLAGLQGNPDVRAVTLDQFFAQVPVGGNGAPASRQAASTTGGSTISAAEATLISRARQRNDAFHSALPSGTPVLQSLDDLLLAAESDDIRSENRAQAVGTYEHALDAQLSQIELATERTITLTSRTGRIPITFLSSAPYPLVADVTLSSDKFEFPQGASFPHFTIAHSTNPLLVQVQARTSGDLPLTVTLTAPQTDPGAPPLVIAHGELTVRSTATSLVGILLTLLAIAVLVAWWVRTWRRGRRHAVRSGPPS